MAKREIQPYMVGVGAQIFAKQILHRLRYADMILEQTIQIKQYGGGGTNQYSHTSEGRTVFSRHNKRFNQKQNGLSFSTQPISKIQLRLYHRIYHLYPNLKTYRERCLFNPLFPCVRTAATVNADTNRRDTQRKRDIAIGGA